MTDRQKKGLGTIVSGIVCVVVGIVLMAATQTPDWVVVGVNVVGVVASALGLVFYKPDTE
jgi:hypothetical protein